MNKSTIAGIVAGGLVVACIAFVVVLLLMKALWASIVPDIFPGAVLTGLVAREISWVTAAKIAVFVAILSGIGRGSKCKCN